VSPGDQRSIFSDLSGLPRALQLAAEVPVLLEQLQLRVTPLTGEPPTWRFESPAILPGWLVTWTITPSGGRLQIRDLRLRAGEEDAGGLTQAQLGNLSVERMLDTARKVLEAYEGLARAQEQLGFPPSGALRDAAAASTTHRGRPQLPDAYFEDLAEAYLAESAQGRSGLYERIAERLGLEDPAILRTRLHLARKRGWLTSPGAGRPGGEAGERLLEARAKRAASDPGEGQQ
jgi:hypothetical protein